MLQETTPTYPPNEAKNQWSLLHWLQTLGIVHVTPIFSRFLNAATRPHPGELLDWFLPSRGTLISLFIHILATRIHGRRSKISAHPSPLPRSKIRRLVSLPKQLSPPPQKVGPVWRLRGPVGDWVLSQVLANSCSVIGPMPRNRSAVFGGNFPLRACASLLLAPAAPPSWLPHLRPA